MAKGKSQAAPARAKPPAGWPTGGALIAQERASQGPRTMLAFSTGKDAIAAAIALQDSDRFEEIVPFYLAYCPGLDFVEDSLDYYERHLFGGRRIIRHMHPGFWHNVGNFGLQTPPNMAVIHAAGIPHMVHGYSYQGVYDLVRLQEGLPSSALAASGVRAADSPQRRLHFMRNGPVSPKTENWWPIWDLRKADILDMIDRRGIKLPIDYKYFGRTFDGYDIPFVVPLKRHFPKDYQRLLEWFPAVEAEVWRFERYGSG